MRINRLVTACAAAAVIGGAGIGGKTTVEAQGPFVPPGRFTAFDQLAGLECSTPGGTGVLHIVYLKGPVATLACAAGRFIDLGNTVFDTTTLLQWEKKTRKDGTPNPADLHDVDNLYTWCEAWGVQTTECGGAENTASWIRDVNAEQFAGFDDWRGPIPSELRSLLLEAYPCDERDPCVDPIFDPTASGFHWARAIFGGFSNGYAQRFLDGASAPIDVLTPNHVRAVRGAFLP